MLFGCRDILGLEAVPPLDGGDAEAGAEAGPPENECGAQLACTAPSNPCLRVSCVEGRCEVSAREAGAACSGDKVCNTAAECVELCRQNAVRCAPREAALQTCSADGTWSTTETCPSGVCLDDACTTCVPRDVDCADARHARTCSAAGTWDAARACEDQACVNGVCQGECSPGTKHCASPTSVTTCQSDGTWSTEPVACEYACIGEPNGDCGGVCVPGSDTCEGDTAVHCNALGEWDAPTTCPITCQDNHCTSCTPQQTECWNGGAELRTCNDRGLWGTTTTPCPYGCDAGACKPCQPNATECVDANNMHTCGLDGQWAAAVGCRVGCADGRCMVCQPGTTRCEREAELGSVSTCAANGQWGSMQSCPTGEPKCANGSCVECFADEVVCTSLMTVRTCQNGVWYEETCRMHSNCDATRGPLDVCPCDAGYVDINGTCTLGSN